jgi:hypothetical protein
METDLPKLIWIEAPHQKSLQDGKDREALRPQEGESSLPRRYDVLLQAIPRCLSSRAE